MDYLQPYLMLSSILFSMGIYAVITRKNAVAILMGIELRLNASGLNFVAFNRFSGLGEGMLDGQVFTIFIIVLAAAEAAVALAIIINLYTFYNHMLLSYDNKTSVSQYGLNKIINSNMDKYLSNYTKSEVMNIIIDLKNLDVLVKTTSLNHNNLIYIFIIKLMIYS